MNRILALAVFGMVASSQADVITDSGVEGGLIVIVGCEDAEAIAALAQHKPYLVQALDTDAVRVEEARAAIRESGDYGLLSAAVFDGKALPYADGLVNLIHMQGAPCQVPDEEIDRVLAPGGVSLVNGKKRIKPVPGSIDSWSHYLHGSDNNAVSGDSRVAPPNSMRWKAGPMWCRSHEYNSSLAAMVSAGGRIFYIMDQGLRGIIQIYDRNRRFPPRWSLIARDAFNGVKLWERQLSDWSPAEWGNYGFRSNPLVLPRRLVADGNRAFATLSYRGPLTVLDAATGETLRVCEGTADVHVHEIVKIGSTVLLRARDKAGPGDKRPWVDVPEYVMAIDADSGKTLWKEETNNSLVPLSLCAANGRAFYHNYSQVVCRELRSGKELWRAASQERTQPRDPGGGNRFRKGNTGMLIVYRDVVLFSGKDGLEAFAMDSGRKLWTGPEVISVAPPNCFVATGLFGAQGAVWPMIEPGTMQDRNSYARFKGYDPLTGKVVKNVSVSHLLSRGHHVRCYPGKATERYLMLPKRGIEFLDLTGDDHMRHDWLRGACAYGMMPANGLLYVPPHQCFCYPGVVLKGFNALAAEDTPAFAKATEDTRGTSARDKARLEKGPAYDSPIRHSTFGNRHSEDWPTYRHDRRRSGCITAELPAKVKEIWRRKLGANLAQPIVSGKRLFAIRKNEHRVYCLDVENGETRWTFTADARVDSSPTAYRGLLLFGCTDGWVYCLSASNGELAWRFRAAPEERLITAFGQLESTWPAHGSVLVQNDVAYVTAGRSSYLDGGILVYGLKPSTGEVLYETRIADKRPDVTKDPGRPFDMEGSLADMLVSDGTDLYMYQVRLKPDLTRGATPRVTSLGARDVGLHLMSTKGFLDDTWYDRTYWSYSRKWPGFYFSNLGPKSGQLLSFDRDVTYGVKVFLKHEGAWWNGGHSPFFIPEEMDYELFADDNSNEPVLKQPDREKGPGYSRRNPAKWEKSIPVRVMGMVLTRDKLFAAGPPNTVPANDPFAAFEGRLGSRFCAFSTSNGETLSELALDCTPVFDGLIAAGDRLYMAATDGHVVCLGE